MEITDIPEELQILIIKNYQKKVKADYIARKGTQMCECGGHYNPCRRKDHLKTKIHQNYFSAVKTI